MKALIITIVTLVFTFPTVTYSKTTELICPLFSETIPITFKFDLDNIFVSIGDDNTLESIDHPERSIRTEISDDLIQFE